MKCGAVAMNRYLLIIILLAWSCLFISDCDEEGDNIVGSRDHDIESLVPSEPSILANGLSTTQISAIIYNKEGYIAPNMKVAFQTSAGEIDEFAISDSRGRASATLTSAASRADIMAEVSATVVDTAFNNLGKQVTSTYSIDLYVLGFEKSESQVKQLIKAAGGKDNSATIYVKFLGISLLAEIEDSILPADGISETVVSIQLRESTSYKVIPNAAVYFNLKKGTIVGADVTNSQGFSKVNLKAAQQADADTLCIEYGHTISTCLYVQYVTTRLALSADKNQVPADGQSRILIIATLTTHNNNPVVGAVVKFTTSDGIIEQTAKTDNFGMARAILISGKELNSTVTVTAKFLSLTASVTVAYISTLTDQPNTILLDADPNFIWVKETGNVDQTTISATVLGITGQPVGNNIGVKFSILNGPGGGETIEPSSIFPLESDIIKTVDGKADAYIRSGIKSGTIQIRAILTDFPNVAAQTTNIVIRSGPPYMWIDEQNVNHVIPHSTLLVQVGKHNVAFGNPVQEIKVSILFGDKYNNPVEDGTAVYFTTTGGIITTDATTNDKGQTAVILQNGYPFPYLETDDVNQMTTCCVPNPNDPNVMLDLYIPDFEGSLIGNTMGTTTDNDGIAVLLAYTWGQDQNGRRIKVWSAGLVVFSSAIHTFTAIADKSTLKVGESTAIHIRLFDIHGNPVAAGSTLNASATKGSLSETSLIPSTEDYGYGTTFFSTRLTNDLKPGEDQPTNSVVTIELDSPNGNQKVSVNVFLSIP